MSMPLHLTVDLSEDTDRFDFLAGVLDKVCRMDELHASEEDDANYTYTIWLHNLDESDEVVDAINRNIQKINNDKEWHLDAYDTHFGLLIVVASCCC